MNVALLLFSAVYMNTTEDDILCPYPSLVRDSLVQASHPVYSLLPEAWGSRHSVTRGTRDEEEERNDMCPCAVSLKAGYMCLPAGAI